MQCCRFQRSGCARRLKRKRMIVDLYYTGWDTAYGANFQFGNTGKLTGTLNTVLREAP